MSEQAKKLKRSAPEKRLPLAHMKGWTEEDDRELSEITEGLEEVRLREADYYQRFRKLKSKIENAHHLSLST